jgi:hypothetical protein
MRTSTSRWTAAHWRFAAATLVPAAMITLARLPGLPTAGIMARHVSLAATPVGLHHTLTDILLVPIGALVVVTFRLALGVRLLGPFRSILLAFAFVTTGIGLGLAFLAATVLVLVVARPMITALQLPYFGRVSVMISGVALVMTVATLSSGWLRSPSLLNVAHFPIVVLVLVGEKVAVTIKREGAVSGIWRATTTALVGVVLTAIASIHGFTHALLIRPELLLVGIFLIVLVSTLCGWRLLDRLNPVAPTAARPRATSERAVEGLIGAPRR